MRRAVIRATPVIAAALLALGGCQSMTGRTAGQNIDDATITASVKTKLAGEHASSLTRIDVDTVGGTVYLTGTVPDAREKLRAAELAREVDGVESVVNNLDTSTTRAGDAPAGEPDPDHR